MRPFFTFYGGKWRAAPKYPQPRHGTIIEPFAGSAGYSLRYADRKVILVDADPIIAGTWSYLIRVTPAEILRLPDLAPDQTVDDLALCQEAKWVIGWWLNKGAASPMKSPSAWMRGGTRPKSYWGQEIRERIAQQVDGIRHWKIIRGDYTELAELESITGAEATYFVDPPYRIAGKLYRKHKVNYDHLAGWCRARARPGQVIVCEQEGAEWLPFRPFTTTKTNPCARGKKKSREAVWLGDEHFLHEQSEGNR